jgi:cytochrome c oxidase assembly factor CtaG
MERRGNLVALQIGHALATRLPRYARNDIFFIFPSFFRLALVVNEQDTTTIMKRPVYTMFNVIYQIVICWLLVFLNAYYNDLIIPESLARSSGKIGMKILIALAESVLFILIIYVINRAVLSDLEDEESQKSVAKKTCRIQLIITVCFIVATILS